MSEITSPGVKMKVRRSESKNSVEQEFQELVPAEISSEHMQQLNFLSNLYGWENIVEVITPPKRRRGRPDHDVDDMLLAELVYKKKSEYGNRRGDLKRALIFAYDRRREQDRNIEFEDFCARAMPRLAKGRRIWKEWYGEELPE